MLWKKREYLVSTILKRTRAAGKRRASDRVNLRIDPELKLLLVKAAEAQDLELTDFMLNASRVAAEVALANRTRFGLSPSQWRDFNASLDAPPRDIAALRRLFAERPVFEPR